MTLVGCVRTPLRGQNQYAAIAEKVMFSGVVRRVKYVILAMECEFWCSIASDHWFIALL